MRPLIRAAISIFITCSLVGAGSAASATGGDDMTAGGSSNRDGGVVSVAAGPGGGDDASSGPATRPTVRDCKVESIIDTSFGEPGGAPAAPFVLDKDHPVGVENCTVIADGSQRSRIVTWTDPQLATDLVVAQAKSQLRLELPDVATSPPRGGEQLVGVPVWFWVANGEPVSTTATIPGLSATLTATLASTRITIAGGEGRARKDNVTLRCPHAGTPWVPGRASAYASSDCSHGFDWNGTYTVTATVTWNLAWTATNGQAGTLPAVDRTTTFTLAIHQAQAVTD